MIDEFLKKFNLKYEDLNELEKETLMNWLEALSNQELSVEKIKNYVRDMLSAVEKELADCNLPKEKDLFLKARMRNYLLLLDFLTSPEKVKRSLEEALKNIKK